MGVMFRLAEWNYGRLAEWFAWRISIGNFFWCCMKWNLIGEAIRSISPFAQSHQRCLNRFSSPMMSPILSFLSLWRKDSSASTCTYRYDLLARFIIQKSYAAIYSPLMPDLAMLQPPMVIQRLCIILIRISSSSIIYSLGKEVATVGGSDMMQVYILFLRWYCWWDLQRPQQRSSSVLCNDFSISFLSTGMSEMSIKYSSTRYLKLDT